MKLVDAITLWKGDKVKPKRKNQYQPDRWATVQDVEVKEDGEEKTVKVLLDDGKWYDYKQLK